MADDVRSVPALELRRYLGLWFEVGRLPLRFEDDRATGVLRVREHYRLVDPFGDEGGGVRALSVFADPLDDPLRLPASMTHPGPLRIARVGTYRYRVELDAPASWNARYANESIHRESPAFRLDRTLEVDGSRTTLDYRLDVLRPDVGTDDVAAHLASLRATRDDLSAALRFQVPTTLDAHQREDRLKALLRDAMKGGAR